MWTATTSPSVSQACAFSPLAPCSWMICVSLHSNDDRAFGDARHVDELAGHRGQAGDLEFADIVGDMRRGRVHLLRQIHGGEIPDEFAGLLDVLDAVLPGGGGEADDRRVIAEAVEEAVGREVDVALGVARGNPADRARRDDGVEGIVLEAVAVGGLVIMQVFWVSLASIPFISRHCERQRSARSHSVTVRDDAIHLTLCGPIASLRLRIDGMTSNDGLRPVQPWHAATAPRCTKSIISSIVGARLVGALGDHLRVEEPDHAGAGAHAPPAARRRPRTRRRRRPARSRSPMVSVISSIWATQTSQSSSIAIATISCSLESPT